MAQSNMKAQRSSNLTASDLCECVQIIIQMNELQCKDSVGGCEKRMIQLIN